MKMLSFVRNTQYYLLVTTLLLLWFSYQPLVNFGTMSGVHIDISLLYITISLCILVSVVTLWKNLHFFTKQPLWLILFSFTIFSTFSMFWSPNNFRALVTVGFSWLILAFVSIILIYYPQLKRKRAQLIKTSVYIGLLSALVAIFQIIGDAFSVSGNFTLLPLSYQGDVFGIARPTGFALEPQFLGSLLIAPLCWLTWRLITKRPNLPTIAGYVATCSLLILTLSRGAIIGAAIALIVLFLLKRPASKQYFAPVLATIVSLVLSLALIFGTASLRQDSIDGYSAVVRSVSHLSLGTINLPAGNKLKKEVETTTTKPLSDDAQTGYIESSTSSRLSSSQAALKLWGQSPSTMLFGVGIGGFGASLVETNDDALNSIVNNYYLEILAELGIVGLGALLTFFGLLLFMLIKRKQWLFVSIITGFLVQLCFFSGNANILHIWAIIGLSLGALYHRASSNASKA